MRLAIVAGAALGLTGAAFADTEVYMGEMPLDTTNWDASFDIPSFDSNGGLRELKSVCIHLEGSVLGNAQVENTDASAATISIFLQAEISLTLQQTGDELAVIIPVANETFDADAFDGTIDFAGPSVTFMDLTGDDMIDNKLNAGADDLSPFIDQGTLTLDAAAMGQSFASGSGNLVTVFMTSAAAAWEVTYDFNVIPAPGAAALLGLGGLMAARRRR